MIVIDNGTKSYDGSQNILKDISFSINSGDMIAITGKSGSGKSTLLNLIGQLDTFSSGSLFIKGIDTAHLNDKHRSKLRNELFGFIFQSYYLIPNTSVLENVILPLYYSNKKISYQIKLELVKKQLKSVDIEDLMYKKVDLLSGGEMQRVAIARSLINNPEIILADEPTGNLDKYNSQNVFDTLNTLNKTGKTIIIVTHDDSLASKCDKILRLNNGNLEDYI